MANAMIKVFGVGGAGCNAVNRMVEDGFKSVEFYVANTDQQVLDISPVPNKIILGEELTQGLGAGGDPEVGRKAAEESENQIRKAIEGANMVFVTAGLGGGTGTGAAPVIARIAKELGALTIAVVTKPFALEGKKRMQSAEEGLNKLRQHIDSIIIISNNNLMTYMGKKPIAESFKVADNVLRQSVQTITDLITVPLYMNLDFADIRSVMENGGAALIGVGIASGESKAINAANMAINSPLLETDIRGAKKAIINISGSSTSVSLYECDEAVSTIRSTVGEGLDIIFGTTTNDNLGDNIVVSIIATGFNKDVEEELVHVENNPFKKATTEDKLKVIPSFLIDR